MGIKIIIGSLRKHLYYCTGLRIMVLLGGLLPGSAPREVLGVIGVSQCHHALRREPIGFEVRVLEF